MSLTRTGWLAARLALLLLPLALAPLEAGETPADANFLVDFSSAFLDAGVEDPIDRIDPQQKSGRGFEINAMVYTRGRTRFELVPCKERGAMILLGDGVFEMTSSSTVGPYCLDGYDWIPFQFHKPMTLDSEGLKAGPASAQTTDHNTLCGIATTHHGLVDYSLKRLALRVYNKNKTKVEEGVAREAGVGLLKGVDARTEEELFKKNRLNAERLSDLREQGLVFQRLDYSSTNQQLLARGVVAMDHQSTLVPPPPVPGTPYVGLRVHESVFNHLLLQKYTGKRITSEEAANQSRSLFQLPDAGEAPTKDDPPWSIVLTGQQPITIAFADHGFTLTVRVAEFATEDETRPGMNVSARYKFVSTPTEVVAVREDGVKAFPPGYISGTSPRLGAAQQVVRSQLERRFAKIFKERIKIEDVTLPCDMRKQGPLVPTFADGDKGWLLMTYRRGQAKKE
jgi:hypothetical protein